MSFPNPGIANDPLVVSLYDSDENHFTNPSSETWEDEFGVEWEDEHSDFWVMG